LGEEVEVTVAIEVLSTLNCTWATATLSVAVAASDTDVPFTVAPLEGEVRETEGAVVSESVKVAVLLEV
jgi:hypothetical protein